VPKIVKQLDNKKPQLEFVSIISKFGVNKMRDKNFKNGVS